MKSPPARHVAFILSSLGAGGAERVVSLISNHWAATGWRVDVVSFDSPAAPVFHDFAPEVRLVRLGIAAGGRMPWLPAVKRILALRRYLSTSRPVIAISFLTKINVLAVIAATGLDTKVIVSERNNPARQKTHFLWGRLSLLAYSRASHIVMQTSASMDSLPPSARAKASVIPNPIAAPPVSRQASSTLTLTAVGRLTRQKGFDLLLDAFAAISPDFPEWQLVIWGEGPDRSALAAQVSRLGLTARVTLPGLTAAPGEWARDATIFVLSSRYEGFANALGEAMAAGIPVAAFDCPWGTRDMVSDGKTGLLVPPDDVTALADALRLLMQSPDLRRELADRAQDHIRRYLPDNIFDQWTRIVIQRAP